MTNVEHPNATVPDSVEVPRVGALRYELGFPTPETSRRLFDEMDFQRAVQAYLWGYPAVSFESIRLTAKQDLGIDFNDLGIADNFVDPKSVWLTANDTTIYAFVNIDVAQGPVVIEIPPGAIVGLLDDFWQRSLADVGLLRFVNVARPRAPHRAAGMRPRRQPWVALHESGDRHSRTRHHHGVAPGWPIAHPLVAEGRAAVFWPNSAAIDFARHSARCTRPNSALISSLAASRRRRVTTNSGLPSIHSQKVSSL
jgi:hypothetical protein